MVKTRFSKRWIFLVLIPVISMLINSSCVSRKKKITKLEGFSNEIWMADKNGCNGNRIDLRDQILTYKHYMRGLKSDQIEDILGKPDAQELYKRNQRYYIYFIEPGPKCDTPKEKPLSLFVRFSAVGIANEFTIREL